MNKVCYICCKAGADSMDHVIPDCFFVPPKPRNLLTLPAHHACHNKLDEEYVRMVTAGFHEGSAAADILWTGKVNRSVRRNLKIQRGIRDSLRPHTYVYSPESASIVGGPGYEIDPSRFNLTVEKIVRGLYLHHAGRMLPVDAAVGWSFIFSPPTGIYLELFKTLKQGLLYPGVFDCRYNVVPFDDGREISEWWMRFYQGFVIRCRCEINQAA